MAPRAPMHALPEADVGMMPQDDRPISVSETEWRQRQKHEEHGRRFAQQCLYRQRAAQREEALSESGTEAMCYGCLRRDVPTKRHAARTYCVDCYPRAVK